MKNYGRVTCDLEQLRGLVDFYGYVDVAKWLGYQDTAVIKMWFHRKAIPEKMSARVKELVKIKGTLEAKEQYLNRRSRDV